MKLEKRKHPRRNDTLFLSMRDLRVKSCVILLNSWGASYAALNLLVMQRQGVEPKPHDCPWELVSQWVKLLATETYTSESSTPRQAQGLVAKIAADRERTVSHDTPCSEFVRNGLKMTMQHPHGDCAGDASYRRGCGDNTLNARVTAPSHRANAPVLVQAVLVQAPPAAAGPSTLA